MTIADDSVLRAGETFTKTWSIRNAGSCAWTAGYRLVFVRGDKMGGGDSVPLPTNVAPNQVIEISVSLSAPIEPGQYQGYWQLVDPAGRAFGVGPSAAGPLWVKVKVNIPPLTGATAIPTVPATTPFSTLMPSELATTTPKVVFDFVRDACLAQWQGNYGGLNCPGQENDPNGFVLLAGEGNLEDGASLPLPTLLTFPAMADNGYILGLYPTYQVQAGDHFQAWIGCERNTVACAALFRLSYLDANGAAGDLWSRSEFYDGQAFQVDVDLSSLEGQQIRLVLSLDSLGDSTGDRALWVEPRIVQIQTGGPGISNTPTAILAEPSATPHSVTATSTATPSSTATPLMTPTASASLTVPPTPGVVPTAKPDAGTSTPQRILDSILAFIRQLFRGK